MQGGATAPLTLEQLREHLFEVHRVVGEWARD